MLTPENDITALHWLAIASSITGAFAKQMWCSEIRKLIFVMLTGRLQSQELLKKTEFICSVYITWCSECPPPFMFQDVIGPRLYIGGVSRSTQCGSDQHVCASAADVSLAAREANKRAVCWVTTSGQMWGGQKKKRKKEGVIDVTPWPLDPALQNIIFINANRNRFLLQHSRGLKQTGPGKCQAGREINK